MHGTGARRHGSQADQETRQPYLRSAASPSSSGLHRARGYRPRHRAGEFVSFLGPSGCGKTTLLRAISGLDVQTAGTIRQGGRDISRLPVGQRDFGIVFQSYALFPNLKITRQCRLRPGVGRQARAAEIAARVARAAAAGRPGRPGRKISGAALRRPAAARRARPRAGPVARPAPARRAALGARRARARAAARRDPRPAAAARHHHDHGDPRPGGSADHVRPHRGDEQGPDRAGRHARRRSTAGRRRPSSPISSAR